MAYTKEELEQRINELIEEMDDSFLTVDEEARYWKTIERLQDKINEMEE